MSELAMSNGKHNGTAAPRVSVIICAYNAASFIAQTLASVWAQSYTQYEVIVVNKKVEIGAVNWSLVLSHRPRPNSTLVPATALVYSWPHL